MRSLIKKLLPLIISLSILLIGLFSSTLLSCEPHIEGKVNRGFYTYLVPVTRMDYRYEMRYRYETTYQMQYDFYSKTYRYVPVTKYVPYMAFVPYYTTTYEYRYQTMYNGYLFNNNYTININHTVGYFSVFIIISLIGSMITIYVIRSKKIKIALMAKLEN